MSQTIHKPGSEDRNAMEAGLAALDIYASYRKSRYLSIKCTSYFQVYEELFSRFRGTPVSFVEIGVQHGGSLFMWRDFLGPEARIIGVDINPAARRWEASGFEIHIGDQADPGFWEGFFSKTGDVDVILDDGGHTNRQQIATVHHGIPHIRDGGLLVVEDTGTSYMSMFGNPSRHSFINYTKRVIDRINARPRGLPPGDPAWAVYSMSVYDSMVCFRIDRDRCATAAAASNEGATSDAENLWHQHSGIEGLIGIRVALRERFGSLRRFAPLRVAQRIGFGAIQRLWWRLKATSLSKYFY